MPQDMEEHLDPNQYGNRENHSTMHYLMNLVQFIHTEAKRGHHTNCLAIDYSKAFNNIDINVALCKLLDLRVRPELLPWLLISYQTKGNAYAWAKPPSNGTAPHVVSHKASR